jgi:hypothetical protein
MMNQTPTPATSWLKHQILTDDVDGYPFAISRLLLHRIDLDGYGHTPVLIVY